jgi:hypothetical protein
MADEGPGHASAEARDFVLATYREIAERFRLGSAKAARTKVKRAGWAHDPPNHPADPLRIRVPRGPWDQADETAPPQPREARGNRKRDPGPQQQDTRGINGFEAALKTLQEQLERERARADQAESRATESQERTRQLTAEIEVIREKMAELREERAAAVAKAEAAETQVDDLKAEVRREGEGRAKEQARADLLQVEIDRLRPLAQQPAAPRRGILRRLLGRRRG